MFTPEYAAHLRRKEAARMRGEFIGLKWIGGSLDGKEYPGIPDAFHYGPVTIQSTGEHYRLVMKTEFEGWAVLV